VPCPFHDDRHPSLHVYETAARGWYCFGRCRRGGTIYDLAAALYGYELRGDDALLAIAPEDYVRRLLGVEVPRHRKVRCPFHEDRHASLHVYETAERGWYCFGACRRGGTIYDLAAPLYGYAARGEDFLRLRTELRRLFGLKAA